MQQLLVVSVAGENRHETLHQLSRAARDAGCNLEDSRMTVLGIDFAGVFLVSGNWSAIARLEAALPRLESSLNLKIVGRRTQSRTPSDKLLPYAVDAIALDQPGIVEGLSEFFSQRGIGIAEMTSRTYAATHTGAPMFALQMTINVPADMHIGVLRDEFTDFCDRLNLDAILEPVKY